MDKLFEVGSMHLHVGADDVFLELSIVDDQGLPLGFVGFDLVNAEVTSKNVAKEIISLVKEAGDD